MQYNYYHYIMSFDITSIHITSYKIKFSQCVSNVCICYVDLYVYDVVV